MKKYWPNVKFTLWVLAILLVIQFSQRYIDAFIYHVHLWLKSNVDILISYTKFFIVLIWILGITYSLWKKSFQKNVWVRVVILAGIPLTIYAFNLRMRITPVYYQAKTLGDKIGRVYVNDDVIGYRHLPNSTGYRLLGDKFITITHDQEGNRIPVGYKHPHARPLTIFLGCSVSYGDACWAEDAFPHLVGQGLKGDYINAAGSGYGVAQMIIKARELVPKYKPDYLVVQYTEWLPDRSTKIYQDFFGGQFPVPYISKNGLEKPVFSPRGLNIPFQKYNKTPISSLDFAKFWLEVSPDFVYQDLNAILVFFKQLVGLTPRGYTDHRKFVEDYAYGELYRICKENNTKMIVWTTGTGFHLEPKLPADTIYKLKLPIAYADSALYKKGNAWSKESYARLYAHWYKPEGQRDSVIVDGHPNPLCHRIIADEILKTIRSTSDSSSLAVNKPQ